MTEKYPMSNYTSVQNLVIILPFWSVFFLD